MCVTCLYELLYNYLWPRLLHPNSADNSGAQRQRELGLKFLFQINDNWFSNNLFIKFLYDTLKVSLCKDACMERIDLKNSGITSSDVSLRRVLMVFALILYETRNDLNMLFSRQSEKSIIFLGKNFIGVEFIASSLQVRKDNEEICSIL